MDGTAKIPATKQQPILVVCRSGARSARAGQKMLLDGYQDITNLEGGTVGWSSAGLPTVPHDSSM
jgi:rhodanese-related sulfurtransferase